VLFLLVAVDNVLNLVDNLSEIPSGKIGRVLCVALLTFRLDGLSILEHFLHIGHFTGFCQSFKSKLGNVIIFLVLLEYSNFLAAQNS
jgi:hypothetical protein